MHRQARQHVAQSVEDLTTEGKRILEIGSLDVNGSVRDLFAGCAEYVGIDKRAGRGVDIKVDARDYNGRERFDIVVTCEALEHDPDPTEIVTCAARALRPGGLLIITAAGAGRPPHGNDGGQVGPGEHYAGIDLDTMVDLLLGWLNVRIVEDHEAGDIYAIGWKARRWQW